MCSMSLTAPMAQKFVLLETKPKNAARTKAPAAT